MRRSTFRGALANTTLLLTFFPFLEVLPGVKAEVQPLAIVPAGIGILIFGVRRDSVTALTAVFACVLASYAAVTFLLGITPRADMLQALAYITPLILFAYLRKEAQHLSYWPLIAFTTISLVVGLLQQADYFAPIGEALRLHLLIPRMSFSPFGGARGITLLTPEPSQAARLLFQGFAILPLLSQPTAGGRQRLLRYILSTLLILMIFLTRSATGVAFLLLLAAAFALVFMGRLVLFRRARRHSPILAIMIAASFGALTLVALPRDVASSIRFVQVAQHVAEPSFWHQTRTEILSSLGGKRLPTVTIGYASIGSNPFGHGVASYTSVFPAMERNAGIDLASLPPRFGSWRFSNDLKPDAYAASVAMDMGLPGLLALLALVATAIIRGRPRGGGLPYLDYAIAVAAVAAFMIFFYSSSALPVPWVLLALASAPDLATKPAPERTLPSPGSGNASDGSTTSAGEI